MTISLYEIMYKVSMVILAVVAALVVTKTVSKYFLNDEEEEGR